MSLIYHLTTSSDWSQAQADGRYIHPSLQEEGFIHASTPEQVAATANRFYKGNTDLILLHIDTDMLTSELRWERAPSIGQDFPHIYGPLNLGAVTDFRPYLPDEHGHFSDPA